MALTQISSEGVKDDSIVNSDIKSDAGIDLTKLNSGSLPNGIAVNQQNIAAGQLVTGHIAAGTGFQISNSNVSDSAAIALSKLASTPAVLTGSTNNTITTVTGANAIQGEANLTFNGTGDLTVLGNENTAANLILAADESDNTADEWRLSSQTDNLFSIANDDSGSFVNKVEIHKAGNVEITDGNLVIGTAGHGIDFSANSHASGMSSELLDDYEEGTGTMQLDASGGSSPNTQCDSTHCTYTKIGRQVTVKVDWDGKNLAGIGTSAMIALRNLPFTVSNDGGHYVFPALMSNRVAWGGGYVNYFYTSSNTTSAFGLSSRDNTTWTNWTGADWDNSTSISLYLTFTYFTDS